MDTILEEIKKERAYQERKWGTEFDDKNTLNDWVAYTNQYMSISVKMGASEEERREGFLKAASILVAAIESLDRNNGFAPRHYD